MFLWNFNRPLKMILATAFIIIVFAFAPDTIEQPTEEPPAKIAKIVDPKQVACMAQNIFYEAGSEPLMGQAAVARVVMNRIAHGFGKNPCSVIHQSTLVERVIDNQIQMIKLCQFSWVCEGKGDPNKNNPKYKQAEQVAYDVLAYDSYKEVLPRTALFFHNIQVDPLWPYKQVAKIGNHIFYSKTKKPQKNDQNS